MKALTLHQPSSYLAGVVRGDGWCTRALGLRVADEDFAQAFSAAIRKLAPEVLARVARDERGYWLVRTSNKRGRWDYLRDFNIASELKLRAWLLGLFDSEGNASLIPSKISPNAWSRRVALYSTDVETLRRAAAGLERLNLPTTLSERAFTEGHIGTLPVWELRLRHGKENFTRFARLVGSNIERKQRTLDAIPGSYQPAGHHARIQALGVQTRKARVAAGGRY